MTLANQWLGVDTPCGEAPRQVQQAWFAPGARRLDQILKNAPELPFDDGSKIILLSDAHRGGRGVNDEFAPNEESQQENRMSKMKDLRKQMKKQLKEFEAQIEAFGEQVDTVEAASLKRSQCRLVNLVDGMDAQLKVWQNSMTEIYIKLNGNKTNGAAATLNTETVAKFTTLWNNMEKQLQQWQTMTATIRMEMGADALWQLEILRALNTTASEKLRTLKGAQADAQVALKEEAEQALDDLKHALERVLPE